LLSSRWRTIFGNFQPCCRMITQLNWRCSTAIIQSLRTRRIRAAALLLYGAVLLVPFFFSGCKTPAASATAKQRSLDEWRSLTSPAAAPPRVFVKGDQVRFYFPTESGVEEFYAHWSRLRVPTSGYRAASALLRWNQKLSRVPAGER